jgi:hypothetical protein
LDILIIKIDNFKAISDRISSSLRQKFPLNQRGQQSDPPHLGIIHTLAHPDTTDYLRFPQLNRKIFAVEKQESPASVERQVPTPSASSATYNTWHSFATAFSGIQVNLNNSNYINDLCI